MKSLLLVTTKSDLSLPLFLTKRANSLAETVVLYYYQDVADFEKAVSNRRFDVVYLRDPFNEEGYGIGAISERVDLITRSQTNAYYIDGTKTINDLLFEDKLKQYEILGDIMPKTTVLRGAHQVEPGMHIIKKRISARSRGIAFAFDKKFLDDNYIVQPLLEIQKEYRVYCINGKVLGKGSLKSSKRVGTKVKVQEVVKLPLPVIEFSQAVYGRLRSFDLVGFDVAVIADERIVLIEANRSCQFSSYTKLSGINLAEELLASLRA